MPFVVAAVDPPRDLVLTVPDGRGRIVVAWEHLLEPLPRGRTRLIVRGRASSQWADRALTKPHADRRPIFIERACAVLAALPRPVLIAFATMGHRIMEARHLRGIQRRSIASPQPRQTVERWGSALLSCGILASVLYVAILVRVRVRAGARVFGLPWWVAKYFVSAIHFPMQRKQLLGIARRAEHPRTIETQGPEERQDAA